MPLFFLKTVRVKREVRSTVSWATFVSSDIQRAAPFSFKCVLMAVVEMPNCDPWLLVFVVQPELTAVPSRMGTYEGNTEYFGLFTYGTILL